MKYLFFVVITICFSTCLFSQVSNLNDDFEGNGNITTWAADNTIIDTAFSNPYPEGINTSNTVLQYEDIGGEWANVRFQASENFDLSTSSSFSIKIYVPSSSITGTQPNQVSLKLQDGTIDLPWTTQTEIIKPIVLDQWQEVSFNFATDNYINLDGSSPNPISRTDFNRVLLQVNSEGNFDFVTAYIDDFLYEEVITTPIEDAPTPPNRNASDVISIFSEAYINVPDVYFNPDWAQNTSVNEAFEIVPGSGNLSLEYSNFNYQGTHWGDHPQDISAMEFLHVDIWTNNSAPNVYVISSGDEIAHPISSQPGSWKSVDIPITGITGDLTNAYQFKFDNGNGGKIYVDNLYFWKTPEVCIEDLNSDTFNNSNLPIVIIETFNGATIPDEPKVLGTMKIIERPNGARNFICDADNDEYLNYSGTIGIETRGSSSQALDKKPYGIDTLEDDGIEDDNVELLGMAKENDWILNSFAFDDSMMRDFISYEMAREMGQYAANLRYCEVVVNGDYKGLYALSEKIKRDGDRVDIAKLSDDENVFPEVTGGYLMQTDRPSEEDPEAWYNNGAGYIHEKPNSDDITSVQSAYIESVFRDLDNSANNSDITNGYPAVIDVPSFIDYMLMAEISSNADAYALSTYYHKDRGGKLRAGPIWDYNLTFGNDLFDFFDIYFDRSFTDVWQFEFSNIGANFWGDLFDNPAFNCYLSKRFDELTNTGQPLNYNYISDLIDNTAALISEAVVRENERWNTIDDFYGEIANMKSWIQERIIWMEYNLNNYTSCYTVQTPSLVITKIDYNPIETDTFPESDDLEFIEIQNTGSTIVNLTGIYFEKLGVSYQFPENATIAAGEVIHLAADATTFQAKYGKAPFGTFLRDLSNKSHNLVLVDAFGNVIDQVEYKDEAPWPESADGDGFYLELIDVNSDNALAINWKASSSVSLSTNYFDNGGFVLKIYPNPAEEKMMINSEKTIQNISIYNLVGQQIKTLLVNAKTKEINIKNLSEGTYILNLKLLSGENISRMFIKK
ncbi:CotH kinase family protein [Algibacter marinivivus]|nr:CotH kinase family protein [Algibacter marinivivus]